MRPTSRIMFIEDKSQGLVGDARIGRVTFSKSGRSIQYNGSTFLSIGGRGFKSNYLEEGTHKDFWISGCRKDGADRLYHGGPPVIIDEDVREEYWTVIRNRPDLVSRSDANGVLR
ncbi:MAG: 1-deoxy-D-xylulose-5-phosphate synthase [Flavobacteriales bacterium]|nr:1-deoxy-D-xylulose-5-phosphate synthase [Flavobacteriales bacterium]